MPLYEYRCNACEKQFEALVFGSRKPACPHCESRDLEKLLSTFAAHTGGTTSRAASREPAGGCGTCGDPRGPGSCSMN